MLKLWNSIRRTVRSMRDSVRFSNRTQFLLSAKGTKITVDAKPIAEGGFSFVHISRDTRTGKIYALKKILCQTTEQKDLAEREIAFYLKFCHPNLMPIHDWDLVNNRSDVTTALLLFPFLDGGTLRSYIDSHALIGFVSEKEILQIFRGVCLGVRELHCFTPSLAHRDIKPENIMLHNDNCPVLMDFGSMALADRVVRSRSDALLLQDEASQFSTISFRAPELFDVASSAIIDARTDVWSLGCLLYALAYGYSPFECEFHNFGNPTVVECSFLRVLGPISWPTENRFSNDFINTIKWMLNQEARERPYVDDVVNRIENILEGCGNNAMPMAEV